MTELLNQLPNGGAVLAVIVITIIFLKKQERYEERMTGVVDKFTAEINESRKDYLASLAKIASRKP